MGFFSELKNDLSQAVNTLMPDDKSDETAGLDNDKEKEGLSAAGDKSGQFDLDSMLNRLDEIKLDEANVGPAIENTEAEETAAVPVEETSEDEGEPVEENEPKNAFEIMSEMKARAAKESVSAELEGLEEKIEEQTEEEVEHPEEYSDAETVETVSREEHATSAQVPVEENVNNYGGFETMDFEQQTPTDETAVFTEGMNITGDIQTTGSIDVIGKITGNIKCLGKLNVTGEISGDSDAAEIYAESARITGEVRSKGSVKVGQSTVIVGNIFGSSAVIAGAVKGDIDVHGPVVLDTTAIVMGNIKSQSVQINNGAVIEGMCSQAYADVNPSEFFETLKNR